MKRDTKAAVTCGFEVLADVFSIIEAERLIAMIEECDPENVRAGTYGIDANEAADAEYQANRTATGDKKK